LYLVTQVLEEEKVHNLVTIGEYPLYMVPLDEDVLSFELDLANKVRSLFFVLSKKIFGYSFCLSLSLLSLFYQAWQECLVDGNTSSLWHIAKAIHKLEV